MKTTQFTEAQIVSILRQHEKGGKASDIARSNGISEMTFYRLGSKYGGMEINDLKRQKIRTNYLRKNHTISLTS